MCEIYGFSGSRERGLNHDLYEFYSHADQHPNGWGLALFNGNNFDIYREANRADISEQLSSLMAHPISAKTALAHIRLATIGNIEYDNCHPFSEKDISGRRWTLIHNGTVFESDKLNKYIFLQKGETDSERILLYLIDRLNDRIQELDRLLTAEERFSVLDKIICSSSPKNKLNLLIFDGEIMYVHTNFRNSLYYRRVQTGVTFSTQPLSSNGWKNVEFMTLLGYREGELVFTGTRHSNEYFFDPIAYKPLYMAYASL